MNTRPMKIEDVPTLKALYIEAGYDYKMPDLLAEDIENITVVVDDQDVPVAAGVARRTVELFLIMGKTGHPLVKMGRIAAIHREMTKELQAKGYTDGNAFLPRSIAASYGRHLERWFGWVANNPSWTIRGAR